MFKKLKEKIVTGLTIIGIWTAIILMVGVIIFEILNKMGFRFVIHL